MERSKIILTDADGVLVTWLAGFEQFMAEKGRKLIPGTEHHYSMEQRYALTSNEAYEYIRDYNNSHFMANLPPHADSVEYIGRLVDHGFKFVCITSISSHPDAARYRKINLENLYGPHFQELICLEMGSAKKAALMPWEGSGFFWIEDHIKNAEQGHEMGLKSVLVRQDHNQHFTTDKFPIVGPTEPWKEIYEMVCNEYDL